MTFLFIINKGSWAFDLCTVSLVSVSQTPEVSSEALVAVWSVVTPGPCLRGSCFSPLSLSVCFYYVDMVFALLWLQELVTINKGNAKGG